MGVKIELEKVECKTIANALFAYSIKLGKAGRPFKNQSKEALALAKWFKGL